jgi:hypothetical protein
MRAPLVLALVAVLLFLASRDAVGGALAAAQEPAERATLRVVHATAFDEASGQWRVGSVLLAQRPSGWELACSAMLSLEAQDAEELVADVRVVPSRYPRQPGTCTIDRVVSRRAGSGTPWIPAAGSSSGRLGPVRIGASRADVAALLGVAADAVPETTEGGTHLRHEGYEIHMDLGRVVFVSAFADALGSIVTPGGPAADAAGLRARLEGARRRSLGNPAAFRPTLTGARAQHFASMYVTALDETRLALDVDGRLLLAITDRLRQSEQYAHVRGTILERLRRGEIQ